MAIVLIETRRLTIILLNLVMTIILLNLVMSNFRKSVDQDQLASEEAN